jgi:xanthine dehydrogenase YagT iron-sulfur-binding subunit
MLRRKDDEADLPRTSVKPRSRPPGLKKLSLFRVAGKKGKRHLVVPSSEQQNLAPIQADDGSSPQKTRISLTVNGAKKQIAVAPWTTLLDALREDMDLTGTKKGCDHGQCGACTVLVDGKRVLSCLTLAIMKDGADVTTIEGLAEGDTLHALQQAFIEHDAFQCGYCTPGQICSAVGLIREGKAKTADDIRELMSGNLCRCGAYPNVLAAIQQVLQSGKRRAK